jgi:tetratricopeptide (TPR) repeat protein
MNVVRTRPRIVRGRIGLSIAAGLLCAMSVPCAVAAPFIPASDDTVLAQLPAGTHYADLAARRLASARLDVALPLAQFYIQQARVSGDLRYLGYADAVLDSWVQRRDAAPTALVLHATVQQSRHEFDAALVTLERALAQRPNDPQALLTRATVLRVLGRYREAAASCDQFARRVEPGLAALCVQSLRGLNGHLQSAYATLLGVSTAGWLDSEKSWLYSERGEMAVRLGLDADAERWFRQDLQWEPGDFYVRAAYADLLLRQSRASEALELLKGQDSSEPLLLRIAIAQQRLHDPALALSTARLQAAFAAETQRGEAVHRREQARFLLEVQNQPQPALEAALANWRVQHEPEDVLILVSAARAAGRPEAGQSALDFAHAQGLSDVRVTADGPAATTTKVLNAVAAR